MYPAANRSVPRAGSRWPSKTPKIVPKMLLLFTFEDPSRGSRTTAKRPRPTALTVPISSEATWPTNLDFASASTNRSFIQTSSSSCCSPYTLRVAAGSLRTGSSRRIRVARPATSARRRARSRSTFAACSARVTSVPRPSSVLDVPAFEVVPQPLSSAVEIPPRLRVLVREVREALEVRHGLGPDVGHLLVQGLLLERVLPDGPTGEEPRGSPAAREVDEPLEDVEVGTRGEDDPGDLR